jgi:hypothetical protein
MGLEAGSLKEFGLAALCQVQNMPEMLLVAVK